MLAQLSSLAILGGLPANAPAETVKKSIEELRDIVAHDFQHNQYYVTGNLTPSVFTKDCVFVDPTTRVRGVEKYSKAVALLFDRDTSRADLISIKVQDPHTITTRWRFAASLNVPGKPKLKPYTGSTQYCINSEGLIYEHKEEWDISALDAFVSILFPSFGATPAPPVTNPIDI